MSEWLEVIDYWFGPKEPPAQSYFKLWFSGGEAVDLEIQARFQSTYDTLIQGKADHWLDKPVGRIAAIIVIDQFSRNLNRGKAEAFAWDHLALKWAIDGWETGAFDSLTLSHKMFAVLPLVHAENRLAQNYAMALFEKFLETTPANEMLSSFYSSAKDHRDIIAQFGRYPHRNRVLGRQTTAAEAHYLESGAKRFGQ